MDLTNIIASIRRGIAVVDELAPLAGIAGPRGAAIGQIVGGLVDLAQVALEAVEQGRAIAGADSKAELEAILADLRTRNEALADAVRDS